ncbi:MAG TPA: histidine kinase [Chitinophagaceae bacterium]|nr:histidine kinase [Chitinophagaceae bacterium]
MLNPVWSRYLFKYKLYHLPFWFAYHFMWWTLRIGSPMAVLASLGLPHAAFKFFFYMVFQAIGVYFNLYFLVPRYLEKGRYLYFIITLLLTIVGTAMLIVSGYYIGAWVLNKPFEELYHTNPANYFSLFESGALPSTAASMTLAMSIKLTKNWIQSKRREQALEKEKLETELKFLRAQFNPHFLFNAINSIFVLIHKNPKMASESLAKFSELLRYQLYECNEQQIPVTQELKYLENFIELQKLRQDGNVEMKFNLEIPAHPDLFVAPFIIMPFVENAFKHVSQHKNRANWIIMNCHFDNGQLHLEISNSTASNLTANDAVSYRGIGLQNVQRRLDLLYPNQYDLNIQQGNDQFLVRLKLKLMMQKINLSDAFQVA